MKPCKNYLKSHYFNCKAQALLELAIFGTLLVMLLGVLINYGLRYNFQHQAMQETFREVLAASKAKNDYATYAVIKDKHIPDPTDPFATGSFVPISDSESVVWSNELYYSPDNYADLPETTYKIDNAVLPPYKTAGYLIFYNIRVDNGSIKKYEEVFGGDISVAAYTIHDWSFYKWFSLQEVLECIDFKYNADGTITGTKKRSSSTNICFDLEHPFLFYPSGTMVLYKVRVFSGNAGEMIDLDSATRQCRMITDVAFCKKECERAKGEHCQEICNLKMIPPNQDVGVNYGEKRGGTWYCVWEYDDPGYTHKFFSKLDLMRRDIKDKRFGLQPDYTQNTNINNQLIKNETASGITTKDILRTQAETRRKIITNFEMNRSDGEDSGSSSGYKNWEEERISKTGGNKTIELETKW